MVAGAQPRHACLLLAAGYSRRLGQDKAQLAHPSGGTLLERVVRVAWTTAPDALLVVRQPGQPLRLPADLMVQRIDCPDAGEGMAAALRAGLGALPAPVHGVLVLVLDQIGLTADHLHCLLARWREAPGQAVASGYAGITGVPAVLPRSWWPVLLRQAQGDRGAREWLRRAPDNVTVVTAEALASDLDGPEPH